MPGIFDTYLSIPLQRKSFKEANHSLMTVPGVNDTSPATCSFCTYNDMYVLYATIGKFASSIRHSHIMSWNAWLGRRTVRLR